MEKGLVREGGVQTLSGGKLLAQSSERRRLEPQAGGGEAQSKRVRLQARAAQWGSSGVTGGESIAHATIAGLYDLEETIGKGHFAVVKVARHVFTEERVAVKIIDRTRLGEKERLHLFQEVMCMKLVQHRYIVRLYEVMDTQTRLYLVLELADGGDLFDYIMRHRDGLAEVGARRYFRQICTAIAYCHALHVVHRDLKPENVVFFERRRVCKLTDFGFSQRYTPGTQLETACGSLYYSAPEILLGDRYDAPKVDVWSLGVILFMLVCGRAPFQEANDSETLSKIMDCDFRVPAHVSPACRSLIASMLLKDPSRRASLDRILAHEWTVGPACTCSPDADRQRHDSVDADDVPQCAACECDDEDDEDEACAEDARPLVTSTALTKEQHDAIVSHMVNGGIAPRECILDALANDPYSHIAATFFLLAERTLREQRERAAASVAQLRPRLASSGSRRPARSAPPPVTTSDSPQTQTQTQTVNAAGERERDSGQRERATPAPTVLEVVPESDSPYASDGSALNLREQIAEVAAETRDSDELTERAEEEPSDPKPQETAPARRPWAMRPSSSDSCLSTQLAGSGNVTLAVPFAAAPSATRRCSQIKEEPVIEQDGEYERHSSIHDSRSSQSSRRSSRAGVGTGAVICLSRRSSTSSLAASGCASAVSPAHAHALAQNAGSKRHSLHGDLTSFLLAAAASISSAASLSPMHAGLSASASASPVPTGFELPLRDEPQNTNMLSFSVPSSRQPTVEVSEMIIEEEFEACLNANATTPTGSEPGTRPAPPLRSRAVHPRRLHRSLDHTAAASRSSSSDASDTDEQMGVPLAGSASASAAARRHRRSRAMATHKYSLPLAMSSSLASRRPPPASATSISLPVRAAPPSRSETATDGDSLVHSVSRSSTPSASEWHAHRELPDESDSSRARFAVPGRRDASPASSTVETSIELMDADADEQMRLLDELADDTPTPLAARTNARASTARSYVSDSPDNTDAAAERRSRASAPAAASRDADDLRPLGNACSASAARVRESLALRERSRSEGFGNVNMRARALMQQRKKRNSVNTQQSTVSAVQSASCSPRAGAHAASANASPCHSVALRTPARTAQHSLKPAGIASASGATLVPGGAGPAQHGKVKKSDSNFSCKSDSWVTYSSAGALALNPVAAVVSDGVSPPALGEPLPVSVTVTPSGGCTTIHEEESEQLLAADASSAPMPAVPPTPAARAPLADYDSMSDLASGGAPPLDAAQPSASLRRSSSSTATAHRPSSVLLGGTSHAAGAQAGWRKSSSYSVPAAGPASMSRQSSNYSVSVSASSNFSLASLCSSIRSASRYRVADIQMTRTPSSTAMLVVHTLDKSRDDSEQPHVVNVLFDYPHFAAPARSFSHHAHAPPRSARSHRSRASRSHSNAPSSNSNGTAQERLPGRHPLQRGDAQSDDGTCPSRRKCSFDSLIEARRNPVLSDTLNSPNTDTEEQRAEPPRQPDQCHAHAASDAEPCNDLPSNVSQAQSLAPAAAVDNCALPLADAEEPPAQVPKVDLWQPKEDLPPPPVQKHVTNRSSSRSRKHTDSGSVSSADGDHLTSLCGVFGRRRSAGGAALRTGNSPLKQRLSSAPPTAAALPPTLEHDDAAAMQSPLWLGAVHKRPYTASQSAPGTLQRPDTLPIHADATVGRRGARRTVQCCTVS